MANEGLQPLIFLYLTLGFILALIFRYARRSYKENKLRDRFKRGIIHEIVAGTSQHLEYKHTGGAEAASVDEPEKMSASTASLRHDIHQFMKNADWFPRHMILKIGLDDDRIIGKVGATQVDIVEVQGVKGLMGYSLLFNLFKLYWVPTNLFRGIFMICDFHKHFEGETVILPDVAEKKFGHYGRLIQKFQTKKTRKKKKKELVTLEDPEFEKEFVVYSTNQIEARYILSTSLMRRILDLRHKCSTAPYLAFLDSKLYMGLPSEEDILEPKTMTEPFTYENYKDQFALFREELADVLGTVEELNLNTRIWSK